MSSSRAAEERTVEATDDHDVLAADGGVPPEVLAESIRNKTAALAEQGAALADDLDRLADVDGDRDADAGEDAGEVDPSAMMTELLETASDLVAVAHRIEDARVRE
ncbi:hypothetical protein [Halorussus halobius]|uniref:hypothetical protein n=1 Tax=Halorussus halobius TaxID=1710537 RepID=UPI00109262CC|nr:hypothetical protein [Halorussus halobius]